MHGAASEAAALDDALVQLRALAKSPADDEDYAFTLYLTAQACLLRDSGADLDDAIACLRELRDALLAEPLPDRAEIGDPEEVADPDEIMAEIEVSLGQALFERLSRPGGSVADLDDASAAVAAALGRMASDAPARLALTSALALQYATRFVGYSGTQDHRRAALALAADCLAAPDAAEDAIAACHVIVAWMILTRQMTSEQRSSMLRQPEMEAARRGEPEAAASIAAMGDVPIDPADADTALSHLRQVSDAASLDGELSAIAPSLSSLAHLAIMRAGRVGEDVDQVADQLQSAARRRPPRRDRAGRAARHAGRDCWPHEPRVTGARTNWGRPRRQSRTRWLFPAGRPPASRARCSTSSAIPFASRWTTLNRQMTSPPRSNGSWTCWSRCLRTTPSSRAR